MVNGGPISTVIPRRLEEANPECRDYTLEIQGSRRRAPRNDEWPYDILTVWMPHSVLALPRQRPARTSSSGEVRLVQGMQPTDR
jgi:hypothetical protein